jgi:hypothetical protein
MAAFSQAERLENDITILTMFFNSYVRFDDARIHAEKTGYLRGDAETLANQAYKELQDSARAAEIVAARVKGEAA